MNREKLRKQTTVLKSTPAQLRPAQHGRSLRRSPRPVLVSSGPGGAEGSEEEVEGGSSDHMTSGSMSPSQCRRALAQMEMRGIGRALGAANSCFVQCRTKETRTQLNPSKCYT